VITEVTFDLTGDGRDGVCREAAATTAAVAVDGLEQGHTTHLDKILVVRPPTTETTSDPVREIQREYNSFASQFRAAHGVGTMLDLGEERFGALMVPIYSSTPCRRSNGVVSAIWRWSEHDAAPQVRDGTWHRCWTTSLSIRKPPESTTRNSIRSTTRRLPPKGPSAMEPSNVDVWRLERAQTGGTTLAAWS
jgi:hypothetical protein